jgi:hypothetical protein
MIVTGHTPNLAFLIHTSVFLITFSLAVEDKLFIKFGKGGFTGTYQKQRKVIALPYLLCISAIFGLRTIISSGALRLTADLFWAVSYQL